jgi:dihydrofolate reductase
LVSVNCVIEAPEEWALSSFNEESEAAIASDMATSDALLLGRVIYEMLTAHWPHQPGKNIGIVGSGALLRSLLAGEPLDELGLIVHPLVLGGGKRLLGDGL